MKKLQFISIFILFTLIVHSQNKEWQCINEKGQVAFSIEARAVYGYSNDLAKIKDQRIINNKWETGYGYIDKVGNLIIPCLYEKAYDFKADVTWVKKKGAQHFTLIDKTGKVIPTKNYKKVGRFYTGYPGVSENISAVYENGKMGFINASGKEFIPCKYLGSTTFHDGLVCVTDYDGTEEKYGYLDESGNVAIPFQFKQAGPSSFNNGECRATVSGKICIINKKGEILFKTQYKALQDFSFGMGAVCTKPDRTGWGFVDRNDNFVIKPEYDHVKPFNEDGYAIVEKNGLKGAMDTTGKLVLPIKYKTIYIEPTKDGRICAVLPSEQPTSMYNAEKEYFDKNLNPITLNNVLFLSGAEGASLMMCTNIDKKIGYMDRDFQIVVLAQYKKGQKFSEGLAWVRLN